MTPESAAPQSAHVAAFFQKHRTGLLTIVFTDLVDSTALMQQLGNQAGATFVQRRRQVIRETLATFPEGEEIETAGDSFLLIFLKPSDAVRFALQVQAQLRAFSVEARLSAQERMGVHVGELVISERETAVKAKDLYGIALATCSRVMSLAPGGRVLMTRAVFDNARAVLRGEDLAGVGPLQWVSHGPYLLRGIEEAVEVCEVGEAGEGGFEAPKTSDKAQRYMSPDMEPVLGWRPAVGQGVPHTNWVLEEKLGEGGFGEVWRARHRQLREDRVFKFCFRADRVRSLKREVTLFQLLKERVGEHPHIVRLHNVNLEEPPYYLEEDYVPGRDLRSWCASQGGVDQVPLEVRLEIVAQAAVALQAAHDSGIIHRDVKPGNILVRGPGAGVRGQGPEVGDQGSGFRGQQQPGDSSLVARHSSLSVKLTDFGIGQVVSEACLAGVTRAGFTQTLFSPGSPSPTGTQLYMAPELLAGRPASTRSDIYSLGVVLYQLISANLTRPLATDWAEEVADPLLREDLRHCFAGKLEDRFAGAAQLAQHLQALPARRAALAQEEAARAALERAAYRRGIVRAAAVALVILGAVSLLAWTAIHQSRRARSEAATAQRVSDFLIGLFQVSDPGESRGNTITAREILDRGAQRVERELTNEPLVQAKLMDTIGRVYRSLGLQSQAQPLLERALHLRRERLGEDHLEYAQSLTSLADVLLDKGDYASARPMFERALAIREKTLGPDDPLVASSCHNLANLHWRRGDYAAARPLLERALAIRERTLGPTDAEVAATLNSLGGLEYRVGDPMKAKVLWERSLAIRDQVLGADHPLVAASCNNLGLMYKDLGDLPKAKVLLQRAIGIQEKSLGPTHSDLAAGLHNLGDVLRKGGELSEGRLVLQRAVRIQENAFGPDHPELARILFSLAELEREAGNFSAAKALYDRALANREKAFGTDDPELGWHLGGLANLSRDQGRRAEAEQLYLRALRAYEKSSAPDAPIVAVLLDNMGELYQGWRRTTEAEECYQRALKICEKAYGPNHPASLSLRKRVAEVADPGRSSSLNQPSKPKH